MKFARYEALGNDYIVVRPDEAGAELEPERVRRMCDRHFGIGSDGVLLGPLPGPLAGPLPASGSDFGLRMYNPDGSEFEKSGNGLRIFARFLWDSGLVQEEPFGVHTIGGRVCCTVHPGGGTVTVEMGRVSFRSSEIPVSGPEREVLDETLGAAGEDLRVCAATLGNPHCIVLRDEVSREEALRLGPQIENSPRFPNRTNVQFMKVIDSSSIQIEIWERGAGYTLASGSSACAAAAAAHRLGLCGPQVAVHVPGGRLEVRFSPDFSATLQGPVTRICTGNWFEGGG